jgi:hypothetical protein
MKNLKLLGISVTLLGVLSMTAFAGDTSSPPCVPGDTSSPPCSVAQNVSDDSTASGQTNTPSVISDEYSFGELALEIAQHWLSIY